MKYLFLILFLSSGCQKEDRAVIIKHDTVSFYFYDTIEIVKTKYISRNIIDSQWIRYYALAAGDLARLAQSKDIIIGMQAVRVSEYQEQNKILSDSLNHRK